MERQAARGAPGQPAGLLLVMAAFLGLQTAGCTAAGMAAGPILTAISLVSDRSVERTVAADLTTAWAATVDAHRSSSRSAVSGSW